MRRFRRRVVAALGLAVMAAAVPKASGVVDPPNYQVTEKDFKVERFSATYHAPGVGIMMACWIPASRPRSDRRLAGFGAYESSPRPGMGQGPHAPEEPGVGAPGGAAKPQR